MRRQHQKAARARSGGQRAQRSAASGRRPRRAASTVQRTSAARHGWRRIFRPVEGVAMGALHALREATACMVGDKEEELLQWIGV